MKQLSSYKVIFNKQGKHCYREYIQLPYLRIFNNLDFITFKPSLTKGSSEKLDFYITWLWFTFMFSGWYK